MWAALSTSSVLSETVRMNSPWLPSLILVCLNSKLQGTAKVCFLSTFLRLRAESVGAELWGGCVQPLLSYLGFTFSFKIMLNIWYQELINLVGHAFYSHSGIPVNSWKFPGIFSCVYWDLKVGTYTQTNGFLWLLTSLLSLFSPDWGLLVRTLRNSSSLPLSLVQLRWLGGCSLEAVPCFVRISCFFQ